MQGISSATKDSLEEITRNGQDVRCQDDQDHPHSRAAAGWVHKAVLFCKQVIVISLVYYVGPAPVSSVQYPFERAYKALARIITMSHPTPIPLKPYVASNVSKESHVQQSTPPLIHASERDLAPSRAPLVGIASGGSLQGTGSRTIQGVSPPEDERLARKLQADEDEHARRMGQPLPSGRITPQSPSPHCQEAAGQSHVQMHNPSAQAAQRVHDEHCAANRTSIIEDERLARQLQAEEDGRARRSDRSNLATQSGMLPRGPEIQIQGPEIPVESSHTPHDAQLQPASRTSSRPPLPSRPPHTSSQPERNPSSEQRKDDQDTAALEAVGIAGDAAQTVEATGVFNGGDSASTGPTASTTDSAGGDQDALGAAPAGEQNSSVPGGAETVGSVEPTAVNSGVSSAGNSGNDAADGGANGDNENEEALEAVVTVAAAAGCCVS